MKWDTLTDDAKLERKNSQILYEQEMLEYGKSRYWSDYERAPDEGIPEQELIDSSVVELREVFQEWIDRVCQSSKSPQWLYPLLELGPQKMADITIRAVIRSWFSSTFWGYRWEKDKVIPPLAQTLATQISHDACDIIAFQRAKEDNRDDWLRQSKFIKNWTPKRCRAFADKMDKNVKLSIKQRHDFGHNMLRIAASSNIIILTSHMIKRGNSYKKFLSVEFHPDVLRELHKRHDVLQNSTLIYRPMLSIPEDHTTISTGGYIHTNLRKPMVQKFRSNFFGDQKRDQKFSSPSLKVVKGLNHMMKTEWSINEPVVEVMESLFKNNTGLANLPYFSFEEFMYNEEYPKDGSKEQQAIWCQRQEEAWSDWYKQEQARGRMLIRLQLAENLIPWGFFYHVYTLDFRGRAYTTCELLSPQSSDLDRGMIRFSNGVKITERGRYWQKIYLANLFDQDKVSFDKRIQWVDDNWDMIERISQDPYGNKEWIDDSKKKNKSFQRLAMIFDITRKDGMSYVPVQIDGKCNGNQHWSSIMGDTDIAKLTGVTPSDEPHDLYQYVADVTTDYCTNFSSDNDWYREFLEFWDNKIDRKVTKRSTMCEPYGLTFYGIQRYLKEEGHLDWVSREKKGAAIVELARAIKASLDRSLSGPNKGKQYLKSIIEEANKLNKHVEWTTPSGFKVVHQYNKQQKRRSLAHLFNKKELIFYVKTNDVAPRDSLQAISPNFIHSLDAAHMFLTIDRLIDCGIIDLCMIHDSFGCHANYIDDMRNLLREEFVKIHKTNQLENFKKEVENQLGIKLPDVPTRGKLMLEEVLQSDYFFA